jgi:hypothetical protein
MGEKRMDNRVPIVGDTPAAVFTENRRHRVNRSPPNTILPVLGGHWVPSTSVQCGDRWLNGSDTNREASITAMGVGS